MQCSKYISLVVTLCHQFTQTYRIIVTWARPTLDAVVRSSWRSPTKGWTSDIMKGVVLDGEAMYSTGHNKKNRQDTILRIVWREIEPAVAW